MTQQGREFDIGQYRIQKEPYYADVRGEVGLFTTAAKSRMPVMLKGPTGCGKTRFVQYMAYRLGRPLITVACHEDLDGVGSGRPVSAQRTGNGLGGRTAHVGRQARRDRLSR